MCTNEKKNLFSQKKDFNLIIAEKDQGVIKKTYKTFCMGIESSENNKSEKIRFKHNPINNKSSLHMVNYLTSEHMKCIQKSHYPENPVFLS